MFTACGYYVYVHMLCEAYYVTYMYHSAHVRWHDYECLYFVYACVWGVHASPAYWLTSVKEIPI